MRGVAPAVDVHLVLLNADSTLPDQEIDELLTVMVPNAEVAEKLDKVIATVGLEPVMTYWVPLRTIDDDAPSDNTAEDANINPLREALLPAVTLVPNVTTLPLENEYVPPIIIIGAACATPTAVIVEVDEVMVFAVINRVDDTRLTVPALVMTIPAAVSPAVTTGPAVRIFPVISTLEELPISTYTHIGVL